MVISSNNDLYGTVHGTISKFDSVGIQAAANELRAALSISSMPGEILGEIRLVLQKIKKEQMPDEISHEILSEITYINSVLR